MKKLFLLFTVWSIIGCHSYDDYTSKSTGSIASSFAAQSPEYFQNQLVVQYSGESNEAQKKLIRERNDVSHYVNCSCDNNNTELWYFEDDGSITTQGRKSRARVDLGADGFGYVDYNYIIHSEFTAERNDAGNSDIRKYVLNSNAPIIAILDTGIEFDHDAFEQPFLAANQSHHCSPSISGYDFVNNDNMAYDDNGHGTFVTSVLSNILFQENEAFRILPVKVLNKSGKGSLFQTLCGYQFAIENGASVINMSLGWAGQSSTILEYLVSTASNRNIITVAAAGNNGQNIDQNKYYPASIDNESVISVSALDKNLGNIASFSNYGVHTVDLAAPGEDIKGAFVNNQYVVSSGTSFAVPVVSAALVMSMNRGKSSFKNTYQWLLDNSIASRTLHDFIATSSYISSYSFHNYTCN